jgi:gliding motility-associated-like protein
MMMALSFQYSFLWHRLIHINIICVFILLYCLHQPSVCFAQQFIPHILPGIVRPYPNSRPNTFWADFDNDGDWDVYVQHSTASLMDRVYRNDAGTFIPVQVSHDIYSYEQGIGWGDYNKDGWLDFAGPSTYGNNLGSYPFDGCQFRFRSDEFTRFNIVGLVGSNSFGALWADEDGDGDQDVLTTSGHSEQVGNVMISVQEMTIFRWNQGEFRKHYNLPDIKHAYATAWKDYDRDGDLDILLRTQQAQTVIYQKEGDSYRKMPYTFGKYPALSVEWADVNQDGYLDVVSNNTTRVPSSGTWQLNTEVYLYEGNNYQLSYVDSLQFPLYTIYERCVAGDIDNDGDIDLVTSYTGGSDSNAEQFIFFHLNDGKGHFTPIRKNNPIGGIYHRPVLIDFDRDGDLDINSGNVMLVNQTTIPNRPPSVPTGLTQIVSGDSVRFSWNASLDDLTTEQALSYNVHIFSDVEGIWFLNGMSGTTAGERHVLRPGNAGSLTYKSVIHLPDGRYHWSVQALDANLAASPYAPQQSFIIQNGVVSNAAIEFVDLNKLNTCECAPIEAGLKATGAFGHDNRFVLQLSDSIGRFDHPHLLFDDTFGTEVTYHNGLSAEGKLTGWVPQVIREGTHYRVRLVSTNPVRVTPDNGYDVAIKKLPSQPGPIVAIESLCLNSENTTVSISSPAMYANAYEWSLLPAKAGSIQGTGLSAQIDWADTYIGPVQIQVRAVNGCGHGPLGEVKTIQIQPRLTQPDKIDGPPRVCPGVGRVLYQVSSWSGTQQMQWNLPAGVTFSAGTLRDSTAVYLDFSPAFSGGQLEVKGQNVCGLSPVRTYVISAYDFLAIPQSIKGPATLCHSDQEVLYEVKAVEGATGYHWKLSSGLSPLSGSSTTLYNAIRVKVTDATVHGTIQVQAFNDCRQGPLSPAFTITPLALPATPSSISGPKFFCEGVKTAVYQIESNQTDVNYIWELPNGLHPLAGTRVTKENRITLQIEPAFREGQLQVWVENRCGRSGDSSPLLVRTVPALSPLQLVRECDQLKVTTNAPILQWYFEGLPIPGIQGNLLQITEKGTYSLEASNECTTLQATLEADPLWQSVQNLPNIITPNGDGYNETFALPDLTTGSEISIYNRWGGQVYASSFYQNQWDGQGLPNGTYYYHLKINCMSESIRGVVTVFR